MSTNRSPSCNHPPQPKPAGPATGTPAAFAKPAKLNKCIPLRHMGQSHQPASQRRSLLFGGSVGLQRLLKNSRFCLSEGAGGFSPLNTLD